MAELSERPTPRKLTTPSRPSVPLAERPSALKRLPKPGKSPNKLAFRDGTVAKSKVKQEQQLPPNGDTHKTNTQSTKGASKESVHPSRRASVSTTKGFIDQPLNQLETAQRRKLVAKSVTAAQRAAHNVANDVHKSPRRTNHVNGIVSQLNGITEISDSSRPSSVAGASEAWSRRPPPKLKRKAPG